MPTSYIHVPIASYLHQPNATLIACIRSFLSFLFALAYLPPKVPTSYLTLTYLLPCIRACQIRYSKYVLCYFFLFLHICICICIDYLYNI
ncbi:hypothetical protein F4814DRAFT_58797 [Daldinia grandis]|nr:hypothetical protein F4814DRAFT_58797 [Daldinia grandis]